MQSLNIKYRPTQFKDIVGQKVTIQILEQIVSSRTFKNCYLFCGPSGVGKTTLARIFAQEINNGIGLPIEIDGASNNGVDAVRNIIENAKQRSLVGEYKIFIIDEAHAITSAGWQAFLKGIEEPPEYTIFIFCTTEPNKIPTTILSRLQRYNLVPLTLEEIRSRLLYICQQENYLNYTDACDFISKISDGSLRNAITALDQCIDFSTDLSLQNIKSVLGDFSYEIMFKLIWALFENDEKTIINTIETFYSSGHDLKVFINNFINFILDLLKYNLFKNINLTNIPAYLATNENAVVQYTLNLNNAAKKLITLSDNLIELKSFIKSEALPKNLIELTLLKYSRNFGN